MGVIKVEPPKMTFSERMYLPKIVGGMIVTIRHLFKNLFNMKGLPIISYPEVKRVYSERFRGRHILTSREDGTTRCVACYMCSTACPAECITIEAGEDERTREKFPVRYDIDLLRCIFCGYCVDACPEEAIIMSNSSDMAYFNREQSIVGKNDLMKPFTFDESQLGYRPRFPEEDARRSKMRREAFDIVAAARRAQELEETAARGRA